MPDRLEPAPSGRARCRSCGGKIEKASLRFGEALASAYGDGEGEGLYWFHPRCAAHRRPEKFIALLAAADVGGAAGMELPLRTALLAEAEAGVTHPHLVRVAGAEPAASGRARCRQCQEAIANGVWRIRLSSFGDSGFFDPLGFVHATCAGAYFGTSALVPRVRQAQPALDDAALARLTAALAGATSP